AFIGIGPLVIPVLAVEIVAGIGWRHRAKPMRGKHRNRRENCRPNTHGDTPYWPRKVPRLWLRIAKPGSARMPTMSGTAFHTDEEIQRLAALWQRDLGAVRRLAANTLDAYGRDLAQFLAFLARHT